METRNGLGLGQLLAEWTSPAAACPQVRGLAPPAGSAEFLGPGNDHALVGSQLEDTCEFLLAVGLAAELAADRRAVQMQRPVLGTGGNQAVEIPKGRGQVFALGAIEHAMSLEVEDLIARAELISLLEIGRGVSARHGPGQIAGRDGD